MSRGRGRLHSRIFLAVLSSVGAVAILAACAWHLAGRGEVGGGLATAADIAAEVLPPASAPVSDTRAALERWHGRTHASFTLYSADRALVASAGNPLPAPPGEWTASGIFRSGLGPPLFALRLPEGRWLVIRHPHRAGAVGFLGLLVLVALAVGLVAYPISRRLTGRLARLEESVEALGAGDLGVRVTVEGDDEVARLAESFNRSAAKIEALVGSQRRLLANASHELRSPLARLKVATSLLEGEPRLKEEISRDVAELDALVGEILLASRLEAAAEAGGPAGAAAREPWEEVDLTALAVEEAARCGASFSGELVTAVGSPRLLRRMARNLVENALRHGGGTPVEVRVLRPAGGSATLEVADRGPGVPEGERERIFEPFFRLPAADAPDGGEPGTGLGLALARQVARLHGGDVVCLARPGGGSLFRATLA